MNLDGIERFFAPKGMHISDSSRATASESLSSTDVMAALGMTQASAGIGLALYLAKAGVSEQDKQAAISWMTAYAKERAPKTIRKAAGKTFPLCMRILAEFAYKDYALSAEDKSECGECCGKGFHVKESMVSKSHYAMRLPQWAKDMGQSPSDFERFRDVKVVDQVLCKKCSGTGQVSNRCRCNGTGKTIDKKKTEQQGLPVYKQCPRCDGRGFSRQKSSVVYRVIFETLPSLPDRTWRYNWKPFYESLVTLCYQEESYTDRQIRKVTGQHVTEQI